MKNTKSILLVAPYCYPIWGPESNVNAKFVKTLTDGGFTVDLISADNNNKTYPVSNTDFYFANIREKIIVDAKPISFLKRRLHSLKAVLFIRNIVSLSDTEVKMLGAIDKLCKKNKYDYVITKDGGGNAGFYCARRYGIRLMYTFNDPWPWNRYPMPYGFGPNGPIGWLDNRALKIIAKLSYKIIFPSRRIMDYVMQYLPIEAQGKGVVFPHTVTSELLNNFNNIKSSRELHILHTGSTGKWRDPQVLFEGLSLFLEKNNDIKIKIQFLGVEQKTMPGRTIKDYASKYNLENYIEVIPPVSYEESLKYIAESDVCLILEANCEEGIFMPTKITDYQQCGKPIWAVSPTIGVLNDLYNTKDIEYFSEVTSAIDVRNTIEKIYDDFLASGGLLKNNGSTLFYDVNVIKQIQDCLNN